MLGNEAYEVLRPHLEYALAGTTAEYETCLPNMDGGERYVQVTCLPDIDETGSVAGCFIMAEDITARKEAEMALAAAQTGFEERVKQRTADVERVNA